MLLLFRESVIQLLNFSLNLLTEISIKYIFLPYAEYNQLSLSTSWNTSCISFGIRRQDSYQFVSRHDPRCMH